MYYYKIILDFYHRGEIKSYYTELLRLAYQLQLQSDEHNNASITTMQKYNFALVSVLS